MKYKSSTGSQKIREQPSFYLLGDSICFGQLVSPHTTWVNRLAEQLSDFFDRPVLVQNASINGNTTRLALERMAYDITSHKPHYLLVQFGMNDCNYWETDCGVPRVSKAAFSANLMEIAQRAVATGTRRIFFNTNHPSLLGKFPHLPKLSHSESNREYNEVIRSAFQLMISSDLPVTLIDVEKKWYTHLNNNTTELLQDFLLDDGLHLSPKGHDLYFKIVVTEVLRSLE